MQSSEPPFVFQINDSLEELPETILLLQLNLIELSSPHSIPQIRDNVVVDSRILIVFNS